MARIRSIKPEFFASEDVSALPLRARLTWIGLWTHCDDHGRTKRNAKLIKAAIWPLDDVSLRDVDEDLRILVDHGRIVPYLVDSTPLLAVVNWHVHQSINRPGKARHPGPPAPIGVLDPDDSNYCAECAQPGPAPAEHYASEPRGTGNLHGALTEDSLPARNGRSGIAAGQPTHGTLTEDSVSTHGGLTSGREGRGREQGGEAHARASPTVPAPEPPRRCPRHLEDAEPPPCGACGAARRAHEGWERAEIERKARAPKCPKHVGEFAHNCRWCAADRKAAPDPEPA